VEIVGKTFEVRRQGRDVEDGNECGKGIWVEVVLIGRILGCWDRVDVKRWDICRLRERENLPKSVNE
jgi:hypothetical protein